MPRPFVLGAGFWYNKFHMGKTPKITKEMTLAEAIKKYPEVVPVFFDYGLHCVGCFAVAQETIEEAAVLHEIDLEKFLKDLNKACLPTDKASKK